MDREGRLYVAGGLNRPSRSETVDEFKGGVFIISPEGKLIEFIPLPKDESTNCAFGGPDLKTLYITSGGSLFSIRVKTAGIVSGQKASPGLESAPGGVERDPAVAGAHLALGQGQGAVALVAEELRGHRVEDAAPDPIVTGCARRRRHTGQRRR